MTIEGMPENETEHAAAEAWTLRLAATTLATGDRLHEHVCRAKIVNRIPFTPEERSYLDRVVAAKRVSS